MWLVKMLEFHRIVELRTLAMPFGLGAFVAVRVGRTGLNRVTVGKLRAQSSKESFAGSAKEEGR